jgi:ABC-type oligopeptide transport system substrate-binding subunit
LLPHSSLTDAVGGAIPPLMKNFARWIALPLAVSGLAACGPSRDEEVVRIAFIGAEGEVGARGLRLSPADQHIRMATAEGLVSLNEQGEVVPGLAERWIVTDDGLSYIFRLRNSQWSDGTRMTGENVRAALRRNINQLDGTSLGLDLSIISEVRAMTGRVIEIQLKSPMPQFLQLLAQPELGLRRGGEGAGPMVADVDEGTALLSLAPPQLRGAPETEGWQDAARRVSVVSLPAQRAVDAFDDGAVDAVFNGHLLSFPLADRGALSRGTVRLDIVVGMFGLKVNNTDGLLSDPVQREALALAIERPTLLDPFAIGGWVPTNRIVPPALFAADLAVQERWAEQELDSRRSVARGRIASWRANARVEKVELTLAMPERVGSDLLFRELASDFAEVGVALVRVGADQRADLELVDRLARYDDPRWFLNQLNCSVTSGPCSQEADALVAAAIASANAAEKARLLAEAEAELLSANIYIPLGAPVRWSLIRGGIDGYVENRWGLHPLFPLALRPI